MNQVNIIFIFLVKKMDLIVKSIFNEMNSFNPNVFQLTNLNDLLVEIILIFLELY